MARRRWGALVVASVVLVTSGCGLIVKPRPYPHVKKVVEPYKGFPTLPNGTPVDIASPAEATEASTTPKVTTPVIPPLNTTTTTQPADSEVCRVVVDLKRESRELTDMQSGSDVPALKTQTAEILRLLRRFTELTDDTVLDRAVRNLGPADAQIAGYVGDTDGLVAVIRSMALDLGTVLQVTVQQTGCPDP